MLKSVLLLLCAAAAAQSLEGDLRLYLASLPFHPARSNRFVAPPSSEIAAWKDAWAALLSGRPSDAARLAAPLGYQLIEFLDRPTARPLWIFAERNAARGLGTYVYHPHACRLLSIQAPHAGGDTNTLPQSVEVFLQTNAAFLLLPGAHRCANSEPSPCDGVSDVCNPGVDAPYAVSDPAHFTRGFFQGAHEAIAGAVPHSIAVSLHGFTWSAGEPDLIVSNATCDRKTDSIANQLARTFNQLFRERGVASLRAGSCQDGSADSSLCGATNVQARYSAGSKDPCACAAGRSTCASTSACAKTMPYPERFLHLEQSCAVRQMAGCARPDPQPWTLMADALNRLFPCWPRIGSLVHAATREPGPLAANTFFTLSGAGLATAVVEACGRASPVWSRDGDALVHAVFPSGVAAGESCSVRAVLAPPAEVPLPSAPVEVRVANSALALFTWDGALAVASGADSRFLGPAAPARPGELITLWATGGGQDSPAVRIAGAAAPLEYNGPSGLPGLWFLQVRVPANAPPGPQPLEVAGRAYRLLLSAH